VTRPDLVNATTDQETAQQSWTLPDKLSVILYVGFDVISWEMFTSNIPQKKSITWSTSVYRLVANTVAPFHEIVCFMYVLVPLTSTACSVWV